MKLLVSTKHGQGGRKSDFSWVPEDEVLIFAFECDTDKGNIDGVCGCRRSMSGLKCRSATTTFKVAEVDMTEEGLKEELTAYYQNAWRFAEAEARELAEADADQLIELGQTMPMNTVIEKRGKWLRVRRKKGEPLCLN